MNGRDRGAAEDASTQIEARPPPPGSLGDEFPAGAVIGEYRIEELRYQGGFASLYRARRIDSEQPVALKILHRELVADAHALERLRREAEAVNQLRHPHIVRVLHCGEVGPGRPFIAMEWLDGRNLEEELAARGPLSMSECLALMEELCSALGAAHERGIVHRDLKAQNVMAVPRGDWFTAKLVDFGMVKLLDRGRAKTDLTTSSEVVGTPLNMAPEQILGQPVDERTDIYALGLLLHQILTGTLPFHGANALETEELHLHAPVPRLSDAVAVPLAVDVVLHRCLEKSRTHRYPSVQEFLADLSAAVVSRQTPAKREAGTAGVYVQARIAEGGTESHDDLLDDLEHVLVAARSALSSVGLVPAIESADAVLGVAPLPAGLEEATRFRRRILEAVVALDRRLAERPRPQARVQITAHVAPASIRAYRGRVIVEGELLRVGDWTAGLPEGGVVATQPMLAGLESRFHTSPLGPGRCLVKP